MRAFPSFVVLLVSASGAGCGAKTPNLVYAPLPDLVYQVDKAAAQLAAVNALNELGFVVGTASEAGSIIVVTTAERASDRKVEDGLECRKQWKGVLFGGWVEDVGGIILTAQIEARGEGVSISLRESGVRGCVPTGYWGKEFFKSVAARLGT